MDPKILIVSAIVATILLGALSNWIYDLLRGSFFPEKPTVKALFIVIIAALPLVILVALPQFIQQQTPMPTPTQGAWRVIQSIFNQEQHNNSDIWRENVLAVNLEIPGAFEMKLDMESVGANFIILANVRDSLEMVCEEGTLGIFIKDAASKMVFDNNADRPAMPVVNGTTICQITAKFEQYARHIEIYQNDMVIFELTPEEVGNFPSGLFSDGKILKVYLTSSPRSGSSISGIKISSVKLNELIFYIPPD